MKLIKVLLCILMMLNLVGCSGNKSSDDKKSGNDVFVNLILTHNWRNAN